MRTAVLAVTLVLIAGAAPADSCRYSAPRRLTTPAAGVTRIVIIGRAGSLRVNGAAGAAQIAATGTACASDSDFLKELRLDARRNGSEIVIEAVIPERVSIFNWTEASIDFEVTVPANVPIKVRDGSGELTIRNVGALDVVDGSGGIEIRGVNGTLEVRDGSGGITINDVNGDVEVVDGSGGIEIHNVQRNVRIAVDGSGGIEVSSIRGDFTVARDGSGGVDYERVSGRVSIPRRD